MHQNDSFLGYEMATMRFQRILSSGIALGMLLVLSSGQLQAGIVIKYKDVGSNIQFDYSGSLAYAATGASNTDYGTVSLQGYGSYDSPVFYNNPDSFGYATGSTLISHTSGRFGTNLPAWSGSGGYVASSGDTFMFRMNYNNTSDTNAYSVNIWGNWGGANTAIAGSLTVIGSVASFGMVDGYTISTTGGDITFQHDGFSGVPEPTAFAMWGLAGGLGLVIARRRRMSNNA